MRICSYWSLMIALAASSCVPPDPPVNPISEPHLLGLRTVVYVVEDLGAARTWYADVLAKEPYFEEPFYVGFNVGGYELGLMPAEPEEGLESGSGGARAYWGVERLEDAVERALARGATLRDSIQQVGGDIRVAAVDDPFGNVLGFIENPGFQVE